MRVEFARDAPAADILGVVAARRNGRLQFVRRRRVEDALQAGQMVGADEDIVDRVGGRRERRIGGIGDRLDGNGGAALLVGLRAVGDDAKRGVLADVPQGLAACVPAVPIVDLEAAAHVIDVAVALARVDVQPYRQILRQGARGAAVDFIGLEIAVGAKSVDGRCEGGFRRRNADGAGRRVLAEERALRSAQNFDAVDGGEIGQRDTGTALIDAVDEEADRGFETGVVGAGADAADVGFRAPTSSTGRYRTARSERAASVLSRPRCRHSGSGRCRAP